MQVHPANIKFSGIMRYKGQTSLPSPNKTFNKSLKYISKYIKAYKTETLIEKNPPLKKTMTATDVLDELRILQKKYQKTRSHFTEYKIGNFIRIVDLNSIQRHLKNLESLLEFESLRIDDACEKGYFSSDKGAEALEFVVEHFKTEGENGFLPATDIVFSSLNTKEALNIRDRNLTAFNKNNSCSELTINLAKLSDEEYDRYIEKGKPDTVYVSENEDINKVLQTLAKRQSSPHCIDCEVLRRYDKIIQKDIDSNPDKGSKPLNFYTWLINNLDYKAHSIKETIFNEGKRNIFKKIYTFLEKNNIDKAKAIIIDDTNKTNYYKAGSIVDLGDTKLKKEAWDIALFDKEGDFIRYNSAINKDLSVSETVFSQSTGRRFKAKLEKINDYFNIINSSKEVLDSNGNLIYTERYLKSKDIPNKYDIYEEFPNGNIYKIGLAEKSENGNIIVEKNLITSNGIKTDYNYTETPNGSKISYTRIQDAAGNTLAENNYKYQVLDEDHFKTTENGIEYYIQYNKDALGHYVRVSSSNNKKTVLLIGSNSTLSPEVLSKNLLPLLKRMPGSFYFDIDEQGLKKIGLEINNVRANSAHFNQEENLIAVSKACKEADFILAHEFGHYRNKFKNISNNPEVVKIYLKEREAFMTNEPQYEALTTNYMIDARPFKNESFLESLEELVAETNAFLYALNTEPEIEMRGLFIQENFPETFAKIIKLLTK